MSHIVFFFQRETMDETAHLAMILNCIENGTPYPMYLFLGAQKYQVTRAVSQTSNCTSMTNGLIAGH